MLGRNLIVVAVAWMACCMARAEGEAAELTGLRSIRTFGVLPGNAPDVNKANLQKAIDWSSAGGGALLVEAGDEPYRVASGLVLRANASLIGTSPPTPRATRHPAKRQPVGSVFAIEDEKEPFLTVEGSTQVRGIQFWYPRQTLFDPGRIIKYPPTIRVSQDKPAQGVTLRDLTFYGEYTAMDFSASPRNACELMTFEHCYGYPLSGQFIRIDYCYDIPRILHCHVNPAIRRFLDGGYSKAVIDSVVAQPTYTYWINHTDNAQCIDLFTFGAHGGIYLGPATYGQLTNFNFDCVTVGIHKLGDNTFNRNWQIAQGSIIANCGAKLEEVHPIVIEGQGHTSLSNVEAFSGHNGALTTLGQSQDFLCIKGEKKLTVTVVGSRMRNYVADSPISSTNPKAVVRAVGCFDRNEELFEVGGK